MASSPTPRDELDEKLKLLELEFLHGVPIHPSDEMIEQIKQAFKDAGYMTGQEWYDRFLRENTGIERADNVISHEVQD